MALDGEFALPGSSYEVVRKIIHAYALCGDKEVNLDEVAAKAGMNRTQVSGNNGFLSSVGVIDGGQKKKMTASGKPLGIAISHDDKEATAAAWRTLIGQSDKMKSVIDMVKIQGGIASEALPAKVAAHFGLPGGKPQTVTATNCLIDILKDAELLVEQDNKINVSVAANSGATENVAKPAREQGAITPESPRREQLEHKPPLVQQQESVGTSQVPIHINIELHLPATTEMAVYEAIFKSIREHLMEKTRAIS